ncbi:MAG: CBS domain-containing protein [Gemmatimonadota bacterium]
MNWFLLVLGLVIAIIGSSGAAALVTTARRALAETISRRLRGGEESLDWIAATQREVAASAAATSLGVVLVGAAIPALFGRLLLPQWALIIALLVVPITLLGGYLLPRWLTVPRAARTVEFIGPLVRAWGTLLAVVLPARGSDRADDVRALAREGRANGLDGEELVMVGGVITFAERPVREIMTPRTDVIAVPADATHAQVVATFAESGYTRIPVYRGTLDDIAGMVHAFDLFKQDPEAALPVRSVSFAPVSRLAGDLLLDLQRDHRHLAVVVDEFGGTAGIVTFEDLLEGLVGEISDEDDLGIPVVAAAAGTLLELDGSESPDSVAQHFEVTLPARGAASFGGLLAELVGRIPVTGERFMLAGLEIDVVQASPTHVDRLLVRRGVGVPVDLDRLLG